MHRSRLSGFVIDCQTADLDAAASFWSAALGLPSVGPDGPAYIRLDGSSRDMIVEVQRVPHASRVHIDIETDDVEAEATRLERLGAERVEKVRSLWVMAAPTGQRFCVVKAEEDLEGRAGVRTWGGENAS
jgi:predicted enzyme related to lactoylglutathione lyase